MKARCEKSRFRVQVLDLNGNLEHGSSTLDSPAVWRGFESEVFKAIYNNIKNDDDRNKFTNYYVLAPRICDYVLVT